MFLNFWITANQKRKQSDYSGIRETMNVMNSGHVAENAGFQISCAETKNEEGITFLRLKTCQNTFAQWYISLNGWVSKVLQHPSLPNRGVINGKIIFERIVVLMWNYLNFQFLPCCTIVFVLVTQYWMWGQFLLRPSQGQIWQLHYWEKSWKHFNTE